MNYLSFFRYPSEKNIFFIFFKINTKLFNIQYKKNIHTIKGFIAKKGSDKNTRITFRTYPQTTL